MTTNKVGMAIRTRRKIKAHMDQIAFQIKCVTVQEQTIPGQIHWHQTQLHQRISYKAMLLRALYWVTQEALAQKRLFFLRQTLCLRGAPQQDWFAIR